MNTRRDFAKILTASTLGLTFNSYASKPTPKVKNVIYIYMNGGMSHIDTFDPKSNAEVKGATEIIDTKVDGIKFGHNLPLMAERAENFAVINSMTSQTGAHSEGKYLHHTSYRKVGSIIHPSLGAWSNHLLTNDNSLPNNVLINPDPSHPLNGFLPARTSPLPITDPFKAKSAFDLKYDDRLLNNRLDALDLLNSKFKPNDAATSYRDFYAEAFNILDSEDLDVFDISQESKETSEKYGSTRFGQSLLLARRLVEKGVNFIEVMHGGWDTHTENFDRLANKLPEVDKGIAALIDDLKAKGLYEDTMIVVATEFGRTPKINVNTGRDHYPRAFSCMLAGGKIDGKAIGKTDDKAMAVEESPYQVADLNATIADAMGLDINQTLFSPSARPFKVAHNGKVIPNVF